MKDGSDAMRLQVYVKWCKRRALNRRFDSRLESFTKNGNLKKKKKLMLLMAFYFWLAKKLVGEKTSFPPMKISTNQMQPAYDLLIDQHAIG